MKCSAQEAYHILTRNTGILYKDQPSSSSSSPLKFTTGAAFLLTTTVPILSYFLTLFLPVLFSQFPYLFRLSTFFLSVLVSFFPNGSNQLHFLSGGSDLIFSLVHTIFGVYIKYMLDCLIQSLACEPSTPSIAVRLSSKDSPSLRFI